MNTGVLETTIRALLARVRRAATIHPFDYLASCTGALGTVQPIGGGKMITGHGWWAARPSGAEAVYKLYAESFKGPDHLRRVQDEAQAAIQDVFRTRA